MRSFLLLACIGLASANPAAAQEPAPEPLTLNAALDEALQRNPDLIALRREYEAALAIPAAERFLAPPSFEAQIWAWPVTTLNPIRTDMYMFTMEQVLPGRGKRAARELVAGRDAEIARREITVQANGILDEVRQAFAGLALARETLVIFERQLPVLRDLAEAATVRYASGHGEQHDTVTPLVELTRLQANAITWRTRARSEETRLNALLGRMVDRPIEPLLPMVVTAVPFDTVSAALERHPAMALSAAEIAREEARAGAAARRAPARFRRRRRLHADTWRRRGLDGEGGHHVAECTMVEETARCRNRSAGASYRCGYGPQGRGGQQHPPQRPRGGGADGRRPPAGRIDLIDAAAARRACARGLAGRVSAGRAEFGDVIDAQRMVLDMEVEYAAARAAVAFAFAGLDRAIGAVRDEPAPAQDGGVQP